MHDSRPARRLAAFILSLVALAAASIAEAAKPSWTITELGALGTQGSIGLAINNRGDAGGYSKTVPPGRTFSEIHAFLWQNGTMTDLGAQLGTPPGVGNSQVSVISDSGTAVVVGTEGTLLYRNGTFTPTGLRAAVEDINRKDAFVGSYFNGTASHAYIYDDGVLHDLHTLGGTSSSAVAVNDKGMVVGNVVLADNTTRAFLYDRGTTAWIENAFGGAGTRVIDINDHGEILGEAQDAAGAWIPFLLDKSGMRRVEGVPAGSTLFAINDRGVILGDTGRNGFVLENGTVTLLETLPAVQAAGWSRLFVIDMNDRGQVVGWGWKPGGPIDGLAFVLSPK